MEDDEIETNAEAATPADELQAARAGYNRRAGMRSRPAEVAAPAVTSSQGGEPPLADPVSEPAAPAADDAPAAADGSDEPSLEAEPPQPSPQEAISAQLEDVKAQIRELKASGVDAGTVHRLFGEIGGITRIVKAMQAKSAPSESELAGAIKAAEKAADEYPEIGGPMLAALKALAAQLPAKPEPADEPDFVPTTPTPAPPAPTPAPAVAAPPADPYTPEQRAAIKFLDDLHPDRIKVNQSPEFRNWLSAKPADFQKRFTSSWDFAFIAKGYSEFKAAQQERAADLRRKTERLEAAVTPQGTAGAAQPTQLTPEAQALRGYQRYAGKRL